jgi:hypothetical protein
MCGSVGFLGGIAGGVDSDEVCCAAWQLRFTILARTMAGIGAIASSESGWDIFLQRGEIWRETLAPGAAWNVICDAGKTATVNILETP